MDIKPTTTNAECECGAIATKAVAFRAAPRVLCVRCYEKKSMRWSVSEEFLIDALEVIEREQSLKPATLAKLRELIQRLPPVEEGI